MKSHKKRGEIFDRSMGIILLGLIIFLVIATGCTKVAESGEAAAMAGEAVESSAADIAGIGAAVTNGGSSAIQVYGKDLIPVFDDTRTVRYRKLVWYSLVGDQGYVFDIQIDTDGAPVDALILDENNYNVYMTAFKQSSASSFQATYYFSIISQHIDYRLPSQGRYYLVIDNSPDPVNGADAQRDVNVRVTVKLMRY